jgi:hypothetical protein
MRHEPYRKNRVHQLPAHKCVLGAAVFQDLKHNGYDVFFDFQGIASGDFERVILEYIRARAHFLVLLTPSALEPCGDRGDWLRREIETALETRRNIVPLMLGATALVWVVSIAFG